MLFQFIFLVHPTWLAATENYFNYFQIMMDFDHKQQNSEFTGEYLRHVAWTQYCVFIFSSMRRYQMPRSNMDNHFFRFTSPQGDSVSVQMIYI